MKCKKCGSENVTMQSVAVQKKRGVFASILWILAGICTCGLLWLIPLLTKKGSKVKGYAICQDCAYQWKVQGRISLWNG